MLCPGPFEFANSLLAQSVSRSSWHEYTFGMKWVGGGLLVWVVALAVLWLWFGARKPRAEVPGS